MSIKLHQIPFSHNTKKVRVALRAKGLEFNAVDVNPILRPRIRVSSGQWLLPVLEEDGRFIGDSTAICLYLEGRYPEPALLPVEPDERAGALRAARLADDSFMELTRRIAYAKITANPEVMAQMFFPGLPGRAGPAVGRGLAAAIRRRFAVSEARSGADVDEALAVSAQADRLRGGRDFLFGGRLSLADISLAAMSAPLALGPPRLTGDPVVAGLLEWGSGILGPDGYGPATPGGSLLAT